jgi:hypothetical protein
MGKGTTSVYWLLILFFYLESSPVEAQTIHGIVRDSTRNPLPYCSVVVSGCDSTERVLGFCSSDDKGFFSMAVASECDSLTLAVRALGYKKEVRKIKWPADSVSQNFYLASSVLQEVVIKGEVPPILERNDTTEFHLAAFSDSTEFSVEDILKKLPGMQVAENGRIHFNGKEVEKVFIDGDDLTGSNYQLATRNVRADMFAKVQAIDGYQENPLLKKLESSERLVLNLKLKDEKRYARSGSVTGGIGTDGKGLKASGHTNLFLLSRSAKTILIGDANNTGIPSNADARAASLGYSRNPFVKHTLETGLVASPRLLTPSEPTTLGLPAAFTTQNNSGLLLIGHIIPVSEYLKVKISGWYSSERLDQEKRAQTTYLLPEESLEISEEVVLVDVPKSTTIQAHADYFPQKGNQSLRILAKYRQDWDANRLAVLRGQNGHMNNSVGQNTAGKESEGYVALEYTFKPESNTAYQVLFKNDFINSRQELAAQYDYYYQLFSLDSMFTNLNQIVQVQNNRGLLQLTYLKQLASFRLQTAVGTQWETGTLHTNSALTGEGGLQFMLPDSFQNTTHLFGWSHFGRVNGTLEWGRLSSVLQVQASVLPTRYTEQDAVVFSKNLIAVEPLCKLHFKVTEKNNLVARYQLRQKPPGLTDYFSNRLFTDYQQVVQGLPELFLTNGRSGSVQWIFRNQRKQFFWNASIGQHHYSGGTGSAAQINPFLTIRSRFRPVESQNWTISASGSRYFPKIGSRFSLGVSLIDQRQKGFVNEVVLDLNSRISTYSVEYGTAWDTWVNVILKGALVQSVPTANSGNTNRLSFQQNSYRIRIKPPGNFHAEVNFYQTSGRGFGSFWAGQAEGMFKLPNRKSSIGFRAVNLLGTQNYAQQFNDPVLQTLHAVNAISPFVVLSWDQHF